MSFAFLDYDRIPGTDIDLMIDFKAPGDERRGIAPVYHYGMMLRGTYERVGGIDLRVGYMESLYYGGHIGYSVSPPYRGRRFAQQACRLLRPVALAHGMEKLYITCNPDNVPSCKTIEALGARLVEIADLPPDNDMYKEGERQKCIFEWTL